MISGAHTAVSSNVARRLRETEKYRYGYRSSNDDHDRSRFDSELEHTSSLSLLGYLRAKREARSSTSGTRIDQLHATARSSGLFRDTIRQRKTDTFERYAENRGRLLRGEPLLLDSQSGGGSGLLPLATGLIGGAASKSKSLVGGLASKVFGF